MLIAEKFDCRIQNSELFWVENLEHQDLKRGHRCFMCLKRTLRGISPANRTGLVSILQQKNSLHGIKWPKETFSLNEMETSSFSAPTLENWLQADSKLLKNFLSTYGLYRGQKATRTNEFLFRKSSQEKSYQDQDITACHENSWQKDSKKKW